MRIHKHHIQTELWYRGHISWILYPHQRPIYNKIREVLDSDDPEMNSFVIDCSRQYGKSFTMFLIAIENCLRNPDHTVIFIGPLKSQVNEIINGKTFGTIFRTAPKELIPVIKDSSLQFHNGSRIRLAGTDNRNYENLRGGSAHTIFLDEAGFMNDLVDGVLPTVEPMTKTTGGKVIYASTPPESLDHDYYEVLRYHDECGLIATYTIWDDKTLTDKQLKKIISQCRGRDTTKFKREYECQRIADSSRKVIPNYTKERCEASIVKPVRNEYRKYWIKYVVADWGGKDKTAVIFAHYDYHRRKIVIEDYLDLDGDRVTVSSIAERIIGKVQTLWPDSEDIRYYCDNNNVIIQQEMNIKNKLPFVATTKGRLEGMVEKVKDWEFEDRIEYYRAAEFVAKAVLSAHWTKNRDEFARSKIYGHYDHMASLVYLVRNIDETTNPVPQLRDYNIHTQFILPNEVKNRSSLATIFKKVF